MADRIVKPDTGNDLVLQNDDGSGKIEINEDASIAVTGQISSIDINGGTIDGVTIGVGAHATDIRVDNLRLNGNSITSTASDVDINITPDGTGEVNISKVDIDSGAIDGVTIGTNSEVTDLRVDNLKLDANQISSTNSNGDIELAPNGTGDVNIIDPNSGSQQSEQNFKIGRAEIMISSQGATSSSGYTAGYTFKTNDYNGSSFSTPSALIIGANGDLTSAGTITGTYLGGFDREYVATKTFRGRSASNASSNIPNSGDWDTVYTTHTLNGSTTYCIIQLFGGGGQGGRTSNVYFGAAGGGSGAYVKFLLDVTDSNFSTDNGNATTLNFILGDGVLSTGGATNGQDSVFEAGSTAIITVGGGGAGNGQASGAGGTITWVDKSYTKKIMLLEGMKGEEGYGTSGSAVDTKPGTGANNPLGFGGSQMIGRNVYANEDGLHATGFGGGGAGGVRYGGGAELEGGAGYSGAIIIEEYK